MASYYETHGDGKSEGDVIHARVVVAQDAVYVLTCTVSDLDQARWGGNRLGHHLAQAHHPHRGQPQAALSR